MPYFRFDIPNTTIIGIDLEKEYPQDFWKKYPIQWIANTGYVLEGVGTTYYTNSEGDENIYSSVQLADSKKQTVVKQIPMYSSTGMFIRGITAVKDPNYVPEYMDFKFSTGKPNSAEVDFDGNKIEKGVPHDFVVTAIPPYKLNFVRIYNGSMSFEDMLQWDFEEPQDSWSGTVTPSGSGAFEFYISVKEVISTVPYSEKLTNCKTDYTGDTINANAETTIVVTADPNYILNIVNLRNNSTSTPYKEFTENNTKCAITFTPNDMVEITAVAKPSVTMIVYEEKLGNCTSDFDGDKIPEDKEVTITFTANKGFEFTNAGSLWNNYKSTPINNFRSGDTSVSITFTPIGNVEIKLVATKIPAYINVDKSGLVDCTTDTPDKILDTIENIDIIVVANSGFEFKDNGVIDNGVSTTTPLIVQEDKTIAKAIYINDLKLDFAIKMVAHEQGFSFKQNITNCTTNHTSKVLKEGVTTSLILTANEGYGFKTIYYINNGITTYLDVPQGYPEVYTFDILPLGDVVLYANAVLIPEKVPFIANLTNCTVDYPLDYFYEGDKYKLIFTANDGFEFTGVGTLVNLVPSDIGLISDDKLTAKKEFEVMGREVTATMKATVKRIGVASDFIHLYNPSVEELNQLSKVRFVSGSGGDFTDYGQFITNLFIYPFDFSDGQISEEKTDIILGMFNSKVVSSIVMDNFNVVDLGTIEVPEKYNNVYDYKDVTCTLYLPYTDGIILQNEYVINQKISIKYVTDLYTASTTIIISSSFTNESIHIQNIEIGYKIPFLQDVAKTVIGDVNITYNNDIKTPYIEVSRNVPYNVSTMFGKSTVDYGTLKNYLGYVEISDIDLNTGGTLREQEEIKNLLKGGIFINEDNNTTSN